LRRVGTVDHLLRNGSQRQQLVVALGNQAIVDLGRLILGQRGEIIVEHGAVIGWIDLEQHLSRFHLAAFRIEPLEQYAGDPGCHVGVVIGRQPSGQASLERNVLRLRRDDTHLWRRRCGRGNALATADKCNKAKGQHRRAKRQ
jgi:hypothetical protein